MTHHVNGLSRKQAEFLSHLAAQADWGSPAYTANVLSRLGQNGWLRWLEPRRGVYMLFPLAAGWVRIWCESGYPTELSKCVIAAHLVQPAAVAIKGKLYYWNMSEHIPNVTFVQSTRRKRSLKRGHTTSCRRRCCRK